MTKFMCIHTFPPGQFTADQLRQLAALAQEESTVKGYRSFVNLSAGRAVCVMEGVAAWFTKVGMPFDDITPLEFEGECGNVQAV